MPYQASHKYARISPRKVRPIADLIRGEDVEVAIESLRFLPNRGAEMVRKVVQSALANADYSGAADLERLRVVEARVDEGPRIKRWQPRARGMAFTIRRRMSHIHIVLDY